MVAQSTAPKKDTRSSMLPQQKGPKLSSTERYVARESRDEEAAFAQTLFDPCHADLSHGIYRGARGFINRFQATATRSTGATNTAIVVISNPSAGNASIQTAVDTTVNTPVVFSNTGAPGQTFYTANANQTRCLGSCLQTWSDAAPLNITGNIAMVTLPLSQVSTSTPISQLINAATFKGKLTADVFEQKWYPAMQDEFYTQYNTAPSSDAIGDTNVIVTVLYGLPVNTTFSFVFTTINEWTPQPSAGLQAPTTTSVSRVSPTEVIAKLNRAKPHWYTRVGNIISSALPYVVSGTELAAGVAGLLL